MPNAPLIDETAPVSMPARVVGWMRSEIGGWTIVGGLAVVLVVLTGMALVLPRGPEMSAASESVGDQAAAVLDAPVVLADLSDLTGAPDMMRPLSPDAARAWNAGLSFSAAPNPAAAPFFAPVAEVQSYGRALNCLTAAVYYEAGSEAEQGQAAVAQVVLNRVRHPAYPRTVCGVVFQGSERPSGCQFTFTCDGALARAPSAEGWSRARSVATAALNGRVMGQVGTATHYHADWVAPVWAVRLDKVFQIQTHIFYRWNGVWGLPQTFTRAYVGAEPEVAAMAGLSTGFHTGVETLAGDTPGLDLAAVRVAQELVPPPIPLSEGPAVLAQIAADSSGLISDPPVARRKVEAPLDPLVPDPLVNIGAGRPQPTRSRIPAPSGW